MTRGTGAVEGRERGRGDEVGVHVHSRVVLESWDDPAERFELGVQGLAVLALDLLVRLSLPGFGVRTVRVGRRVRRRRTAW